MITVCALIAGATYSASYIAPSPLWQIALGISTFLVVVMRRVAL